MRGELYRKRVSCLHYFRPARLSRGGVLVLVVLVLVPLVLLVLALEKLVLGLVMVLALVMVIVGFGEGVHVGVVSDSVPADESRLDSSFAVHGSELSRHNTFDGIQGVWCGCSVRIIYTYVCNAVKASCCTLTHRPSMVRV